MVEGLHCHKQSSKFMGNLTVRILAYQKAGLSTWLTNDPDTSRDKRSR